MQQDNSQNQHADDTAPATGQGQTASPITPPSKAKHVESLGERKFNFLTYNVIGYMANVLMSIGAVYWVERTHGGQKFMDGLVKAAKKWWTSQNCCVEILLPHWRICGDAAHENVGRPKSRVG